MQGRQLLAQRFAVAPVAYSSNGHDVGLAAPVELGLEVGGSAMVVVSDEADLVVQVRDPRVDRAESVDDRHLEHLPRSVPGAGTATVRPMFHSLLGSAVVLGQLDHVRVRSVTGPRRTPQHIKGDERERLAPLVRRQRPAGG